MEIDATIRLRHGYIHRYLTEHQMSRDQLAKEIGISQATFVKILNFKWLPYNQWKTKLVVQKLEKFFNRPIEVLFPPELTQDIADMLSKKITKFYEVDLVSLTDIDPKYLITNENDSVEEDERLPILDEVMDTLTERERKVILERLQEKNPS